MGRPPKKPDERMVRVTLTLRPGDTDALRRFSLERLILATGGDPRALFAAASDLDARPTVSGAIRALLEDERQRRVSDYSRRWRRSQPGRPTPGDEELLADDFMFGTKGQPPRTIGEVLASFQPNEALREALTRAGKPKRRRR